MIFSEKNGVKLLLIFELNKKNVEHKNLERYEKKSINNIILELLR